MRQAFAGQLLEYNESDIELLGQDMVMHVRECGDAEVRIPFHIGDDRSRTWVFTRTTDGIRLKHDHRHEDGSEDDISNTAATPPAAPPASRTFPPMPGRAS